MCIFIKKLTAITIACLCATVFFACAAPDPIETAQKIHFDYRLDLTDLGGTVTNFGQQTTAHFTSEGLDDFTEFLSVKFCMTGGKPNVEVITRRAVQRGLHELSDVQYVFYDALMQRRERDPSGGYTPVEEPGVPGNSVPDPKTPLRNFSSQIMRNALSDEFFETDFVRDIVAKRSGSTVIVTAAVKGEALDSALNEFFSNPADEFDFALYQGSMSLSRLESADIEYRIKKDRIIYKRFILTGTGPYLYNGELQNREYRMVLTSEYNYNVKLANPY